MQVYDVCLMSDWQYDRDLLLELEKRLQLRGYSTYLIWPENLEDTLDLLRADNLRFHYLVDRASNTSPEFLSIYRFLNPPGTIFFESPGTMLRASDKALMHREFQSAGIPVPDTLIIEPYAEQPHIEIDKGFLQNLGVPFVIKPANTTGGGTGVFQDGRCSEDVLSLRQQYPSDRYLVQEKILPKQTRDRRFWFRVFFSNAEVYSCWWNDHTHVYEILSATEVGETLLQRFVDIAHRIARISSLQLFSAEIALDYQDRLVVVDYVNESPDLRRKSRFSNGVPDQVVDRIIENLAVWILHGLGGSTEPSC
ncbi:MAG: hypothetical protein JSV89_00440 [Spirochaetaceae bacterium]|nr:MAG: hypothetical protein JSV89_00440 [Spirochaetaceae bacterium]